MTTERLLAMTDGVVAIIITIMVLELKAPDGASLAALAPTGRYSSPMPSASSMWRSTGTTITIISIWCGG